MYESELKKMKEESEFDLVILGATGFTGQWIAREVEQTMPQIRFAIAGRSLKKLRQVKASRVPRSPMDPRTEIFHEEDDQDCIVCDIGN